MDEQSRIALGRLVNEQRVASLGSLLHGAPLVSMVLFSAAPDASSFDIHISRLAQHTQGVLGFPKVGLMIAEPDRESRNPQTLPRLSIQGEAIPVHHDEGDFEEARSRYLAKFPNATMNFQLADFLLVRIVPHSARLVTGFGRIFDLSAHDLRNLSLSE